jgi:hypothetical protein
MGSSERLSQGLVLIGSIRVLFASRCRCHGQVLYSIGLKGVSCETWIYLSEYGTVDSNTQDHCEWLKVLILRIRACVTTCGANGTSQHYIIFGNTPYADPSGAPIHELGRPNGCQIMVLNGPNVSIETNPKPNGFTSRTLREISITMMHSAVCKKVSYVAINSDFSIGMKPTAVSIGRKGEFPKMPLLHDSAWWLMCSLNMNQHVVP